MNARGGYDYLTGISAFSSGVRAHQGREIVRAVFERPVPWEVGFDRVEQTLSDESVESVSLCSVELRCNRPYSTDGFDAFNARYVERLLSMGVLTKGDDNSVGRTNVAQTDHSPDEQSMYAFSFIRNASTNRSLSFVIAGGGEVQGGTISPDTIVRYGETTEDAMLDKASFVLKVMEKRLEGLGLAWSDARSINVYTKHPIDGPVVHLIHDRIGEAGQHGIHRYYTAPPVEGIEFEMDVKGPTWEVALS